jgi:type I restriction enzyme S subunit
LVPPLDEQKAITTHIAVATRPLLPIMQTIEKQLAVLAEYRSALITSAVTGKIDVRDMKQGEAAA